MAKNERSKRGTGQRDNQGAIDADSPESRNEQQSIASLTDVVRSIEALTVRVDRLEKMMDRVWGYLKTYTQVRGGGIFDNYFTREPR
ncbi:MAG: hypothetical protein QXQ81_09875 [Candidatus Thorarchaeota archaeon]